MESRNQESVFLAQFFPHSRPANQLRSSQVPAGFGLADQCSSRFGNPAVRLAKSCREGRPRSVEWFHSLYFSPLGEGGPFGPQPCQYQNHPVPMCSQPGRLEQGDRKEVHGCPVYVSWRSPLEGQVC